VGDNDLVGVFYGKLREIEKTPRTAPKW